MFIVHGSWLRKYMRWILALMLVVLIPGFVFMFTQTGSVTEDRPLPKIDGKPVAAGEFQNARNAVIAQYLISSGDRLQQTPDFQDQLAQQAVLRLLLLEKARALGMRVSPESLIQYIRRQPFFLDQRGQFDPERYRQFTIRLLHIKITEPEFEEMMRQQFLIERLREIVTAGARVTPLEVRQAFTPLYERVTIDYVRFRAADQVPPEISDDEAAAWFKEHQEEYRTARLVQVRFARFEFDPEAETIADEDLEDYYHRTDDRFTNEFAVVKDEVRRELAGIRAKRTAGNRATEFTVKLVPDSEEADRPDFRRVADQTGAAVGETKFFAPADGAPELPIGPELGMAAATLSAITPFSDPLEGTNAYYVLEFVAEQPPKIPEFAAVRAKIVVELQKQKSHQAALEAGQQAARRVQELVADGKPFAAACAELKLTPIPAGPFSFATEDEELPTEQVIKETALGLPLDGISPFLRAADGGLFFHVRDRQPPDADEFEKQKDRFTRMLSQRSQESLWDTWVHSLWQQQRVDLGPIRPPPPPPPPEDEDLDAEG